MYWNIIHYYFLSCCCSVLQSCPTLCDPMDCSTPGFPVFYYLLKFAQTHVYWVVMSSNHLIFWHPLLLLPSIIPASGSFPMSHLFTSGGQSIGVSASASVLPINIQNWFLLGLNGLILLSKGFSRDFSKITIQRHQFFGAQPSLWSNSHIHTWLLEKTTALTTWNFVGKIISLLFNMLSRFVMFFLSRTNVF